ncbi:MAG: hypothetical protein HYZ47_02390 [Simkania negevensis]|nr:hypothetical protein [Simkania negevensis]
MEQVVPRSSSPGTKVLYTQKDVETLNQHHKIFNRISIIELVTYCGARLVFILAAIKAVNIIRGKDSHIPLFSRNFAKILFTDKGHFPYFSLTASTAFVTFFFFLKKAPFLRFDYYFPPTTLLLIEQLTFKINLDCFSPTFSSPSSTPLRDPFDLCNIYGRRINMCHHLKHIKDANNLLPLLLTESFAKKIPLKVFPFVFIKDVEGATNLSLALFILSLRFLKELLTSKLPLTEDSAYISLLNQQLDALSYSKYRHKSSTLAILASPTVQIVLQQGVFHINIKVDNHLGSLNQMFSLIPQELLQSGKIAFCFSFKKQSNLLKEWDTFASTHQSEIASQKIIWKAAEGQASEVD